MKKINFLIIVCLLSLEILVAQTNDSSKAISVCVKTNEMELYNLVMQYRKQHNLSEIPISASLTYVAQTHCKDLVENFVKGSECNMHSWSTKGKWSACCYTNDHRNAIKMWNKPSELTNYKGNGYEIAFYTWSSANANYTATAAEALEGWKSSSGHNDVILNKSIWNDIKWNAIGIGIYRGYAVIWFGAEKDVEATPSVCY